MDQTSSPMPPHPENFRIPDSLMEKLREANSHFQTARRQLEEAVSDTGDQHRVKVNERAAELRRAESELEDINREIQEAMKAIRSSPSESC